MNIEHRTLNVQHRIMYSVDFIKKTERSESILRHSIFDILRFCGSLFPGSAVFRSRLERDSLFNPGLRSTFDFPTNLIHLHLQCLGGPIHFIQNVHGLGLIVLAGTDSFNGCGKV